MTFYDAPGSERLFCPCDSVYSAKYMVTIVETKADLVAYLQAHCDTLRRFGVRRLGVFGSFQRQTQQPTSDIDLLVEFEPGTKTFRNYMGLIFWLEDTLGRSVDLLTTESLSPYIGPYILEEVEYVSLGDCFSKTYSE